MFEVWGESAEGKLKPFRFLEEPTNDDIEVEFVRSTSAAKAATAMAMRCRSL